MNHIRTRVDTLVKELRKHIVKSRKPVSFLYRPAEYKTNNDIPESGWKPFGLNETWGGAKDLHAWFKCAVQIPDFKDGERVCMEVDIAQGWDASNPQYLVYIGGKIFNALDTNHKEICFDKGGTYEVCLYAYSGMQSDAPLNMKAEITARDIDVEGLCFDLEFPLQVTEYLQEGAKEYKDILLRLNDACNLLDLRDFKSDAFFASVKKARRHLDKNFYSEYCKPQNATVTGIGHTHIDVAWLWTVKQTVEKAQRSFATVLNLMDRYPEYKFMSSQAALYEMVKENAPELYDKIKERVKEGRWEAEGSMWVEADCNLPSGESLVRQILYGKRFFKNEFGVDTKLLWLPDVFGYSAALPQILRKSGVDAFVTSKISWNDTNQMPYDTFMWKGIDGTEILTYFLTAQDKKRDCKPSRFTTYNAVTTAQQLAGTWDRYQQKELNDEVLLTFGYGDGGGGPTYEMLEGMRRGANGVPGCVNAGIGTAGGFIKRLADKVRGNPRLPRWAGELYLEYHRGTYTTMARNKRNNRKSEFLYQNIEAACVLSGALTGHKYPEKELRAAWKTILINQFHDIIPGSSIKEVYDVSDAEYRALAAAGEKLLTDARGAVAKQIKSDGGLLVFNPNGFMCSAYVRAADGDYVSAQDIPAKGYKVIAVKKEKPRVKTGKNLLENDFVRLEFDKAYRLVSVFDKKNGREVLRKGCAGNALEAYEDFPDTYDAWELQPAHKEKMWRVDDVQSAAEVRQGARAGIKVRRKFMDSEIVQTVWLYDGGSRIDFETEADWRTEHIALKAAFPVEINASRATYDIQFGTTERPVHRNTSWDAARFEVCAHKFADLSEEGYGVAVISDCKYGYDILESDMRITLLRCPTYPNPEADKGGHKFTYSLYPHAGGCASSDVLQQAFELNNPMSAVEIKANPSGTLPCEYSFVSVNRPNVVIDTVKKAEDGGAVIVRAYEAGNRRGEAVFTFGEKIKSAALCNLLEEETAALEVFDNKVRIAVKPFEIVTIKVCK